MELSGARGNDVRLEMHDHPAAECAGRDNVRAAEDGEKVVEPGLVRQVGDLKLQGSLVPLLLEKIHSYQPVPDGTPLDARGSSLEC